MRKGRSALMAQTTYDWRLPENRREAFQRFYTFHLTYRTHPGCVYFMLPAISAMLGMTDADKAWLVWLNGNTENPVTTWLLLQAAPHASDWRRAVDYWNDHYSALQWDTDRRHQKSKFGIATERWAASTGTAHPEEQWLAHAGTWREEWAYAVGQPYMGRLSAWSMLEYARILLPGIPDADDLMLDDRSGSTSHRDGLAVVAGYDAAHWKWDDVEDRDLLPRLQELGVSLLDEARVRNPYSPDVCNLTLESTLCTYKSWHKRNRRYPNVYADMLADRIRHAEKCPTLPSELMAPLWQVRALALPEYLRCESVPGDPGLCREKQNYYLDHGVPVNMHRMFPDMDNDFNRRLEGRL